MQTKKKIFTMMTIMMMTMMMTVIRIPIFHGLENIFHLKLIQIRLKKKELM